MKPLQTTESGQISYRSAPIPSAKIEYAFYCALFYSLMADVFEISIPLLAGALVLGVAMLCLWELRSCAKIIYAPVFLLLACVLSLLVIQNLMHDLAIIDSFLRPFIIWTLQLIIVQSLCLRAGFSLRYPIVLLLLAAPMLPYIAFNPGEVERARVDVELGVQGGLSHPGGLSEWFGFFAVYFAICGLETKRFTYRIGAWTLAVGSLFVVGLTVSRGPIFGAALAIVVGFRGLLRRGFLPLLLLIIVAGVTYESGLFDEVISNYSDRGFEETGREELWPAVIERIFESPETPLIGVGLAKTGTYALSAAKSNPPHNAFLYFLLASGIVPFAFFVGFWLVAALRSIRSKDRESDPYRVPYWTYTFVAAMLGDSGFMSPWALLTLSVSAGSAVVYGKQRLLLLRLGNKIGSRLVTIAPPTRNSGTVAHRRL